MKYIALLRGINVGNSKRIEMKHLKAIFESIGYTNVFTYINSGNVIFEASAELATIYSDISKNFSKNFDFQIPTLIKTSSDLALIEEAIPSNWLNDEKQRTDVAFLFDEIDSNDIINELPIKKEYIDIRYTKGALFWNVKRENYSKSHLNKLIGHRFYQFMTIRNINTVRYLAQK